MEAISSPEQPRTAEIGIRFINNLERKGVLISNPEFQKVGVEAIQDTNERGSPYLFEKVRKSKQSPDGYLIGVGFANVFTMLEAFPEGRKPKAIILFDVDPEVVGYGQGFIEEMKNASDYPHQELLRYESVLNENWMSDPKAALKKYGPMLQQLAREGNLVIARADMSNPNLILELSNLPDLKNSNNVIYLSNIADHIYRRNYDETLRTGRYELAASFSIDFSKLKALSPNPAFRNYYIDTLTSGLLDYRLRIGTQPPVFESYDFWQAPYEIGNWQTKPIDEIDGRKPNPIWEDIQNYSQEQLISLYNDLKLENDKFKRADYIESQFNGSRQRHLDDWEKDKQRSKEPPEEREHTVMVYEFPKSSLLEDQVKKALSLPYSYDRDFIPYLAKLWGTARYPYEIQRKNLARRHSEKDIKTGKIKIVVNPLDALRGIIEQLYISSPSFKLAYEELAMAKIYQEMKRRTSLKRPLDKIDGRTFEELAKTA